MGRLQVKGYRLKVMFSVACARNLGGNLHVKSKDLNGPEIYLRFYFPKIFLAKQHHKEDFPQRFLAVGYPKISVSSVCSVDYSECPPWIKNRYKFCSVNIIYYLCKIKIKRINVLVVCLLCKTLIMKI